MKVCLALVLFGSTIVVESRSQLSPIPERYYNYPEIIPYFHGPPGFWYPNYPTAVNPNVGIIDYTAAQTPDQGPPRKNKDDCNVVPNYISGGKKLWLSWRGCSKLFQAKEIAEVCSVGGMKPVALSNPELAKDLAELSRREDQRSFWAGGSTRSTGVEWSNGVQQNFDQLGAFYNIDSLVSQRSESVNAQDLCFGVANESEIRLELSSCSLRKAIICEA